MNILIYDKENSDKLIGWFNFEPHTFFYPDENTCFEDVLLNTIKEAKDEYWEHCWETVTYEMISSVMTEKGYKNKWIPIPYDAKSATTI